MEFIVFQHNDRDEEIGAKSYLSLYSLPEYSLVQSHILPIDHPGTFVGSHCNGIYFFTDLCDNFVIINLSKKQFKPLIPPKLEPCAQIHTCGIGWDPVSYVYKIVVAYRFSEIIDNQTVFQGPKNRARLYSFGTDSWTPIKCLDTFSADFHSVYIGHVRSWIAMTESNGEHHDRGPLFVQFEVVSFNFLTEKFNLFSLPEDPCDGRDYNYNLVEYGEKLGVVRYSMPHVSGSVDHRIWVWVRKGQEWIIVHTFCSGPVETVLALKYERQLILEALCVDDDERSEVHVVDVDGDGQPRRLKIDGQRFELSVLPFKENGYSLPGGQPLIKFYPNDEDE